MVSAESPDNELFNAHLRKDVEQKFAKKRAFLEGGLRRARFEEGIHLKQEKYNRYERLFEKYASQDMIMEEGPTRGSPKITI